MERLDQISGALKEVTSVRSNLFFLCDPQDLTALAKELRAVDDVRPQNKATDYSSSSEDSDTTDEDDDEEVDQEAGEESTSGPEDSKAVYVFIPYSPYS